jgi:hypothetical protein
MLDKKGSVYICEVEREQKDPYLVGLFEGVSCQWTRKVMNCSVFADGTFFI